MDWKRFPTDEIEQRIAGDEQLISQLRARQMDALAELDRRQVASADGARSMSEWTAARLDMGPDTARSLVRTMRRLQDRPDLKSDLAAGDLSFDRVEALSRIRNEIGHMLHADVAGVRREAAKRARITAGSEYRSAEDQFLVMQPALDESWWKVWGGLDGPTGAVVDKTLTEKADSLPELPDGSTGSQGWRKAMALAEVCVSGEAPPAQVTMFVDAPLASESNGEIGVMIDAGPKAGRQALEAILCDATTEITVKSEDGVPLAYGRRSRTVPPALRRTVFYEAGGVCAADGCNSGYRIEAHHIIPWSKGGTTDPDNLVALCWFHHHIVIHQRGFTIHRHPHGRIRFRKPERPT